jgi:hypothetical protein
LTTASIRTSARPTTRTSARMRASQCNPRRTATAASCVNVHHCSECHLCVHSEGFTKYGTLS